MRHVGLAVAAAHPHRMQLHHLAAVVLVQPFAALLRIRIRRVDSVRARVWPDRKPVVEIHHHGRRLGRGQQQVAKLAQRMRANRIALVGGGVPLVGILGHEDVEVIEPEVGHHLLQLALGHDRTHHLGLGKFVADPVRSIQPALHRVEDFALVRVQVAEELILLRPGHVLDESYALLDRQRVECGHAPLPGQHQQFAHHPRGDGLSGFLFGRLLLVGQGLRRMILVDHGLLIAVDLHRVQTVEQRVRRVGPLAFGHLAHVVVGRIGNERLLGVHPQRGVVTRARVPGGIGNSGRVQLLLEPLRRPLVAGRERQHMLHISRARPVGEPAQHLHRTLARIQRHVGRDARGRQLELRGCLLRRRPHGLVFGI